MASRYDDSELEGPAPRKRRAPAKSPESRELQLISMAMDEAEVQIREGRASSQLLTHFVKAGSTRDSLEKERLIQENALLRKKIEDLDTAVQVKALLDDALKAFRGYSGNPDPEDDQDELY